jgi:hypothetical protein
MIYFEIKAIVKFYSFIITLAIVLLTTSCNRTNGPRPPRSKLTDIAPLIRDIKGTIEVKENGRKFSVYPQQYQWEPAREGNQLSWKIKDRKAFTIDYYGYKRVTEIMEYRYPNMGKTNTLNDKSDLKRINLGSTREEVLLILGVPEFVSRSGLGDHHTYLVNGRGGEKVTVFFNKRNQVIGTSENISALEKTEDYKKFRFEEE